MIRTTLNSSEGVLRIEERDVSEEGDEMEGNAAVSAGPLHKP